MREYSIGTLLDIESSFTDQQIQDLSGAGEEVLFGPGETIYRQGNDAGHIFFLCEGEVKSVLIGHGGEACVIRLHLAGSLLGLSALASRPLRDADAIATSKVKLARIDRSDFVSMLRSDANIAMRVTQLLVDRMSDFHHRVGDLLAQNVEKRLAQSLISLSRPSHPHSDLVCQPIRLTQEELANLLNTRRQTISVILSHFASIGLVEKRGRDLIVTDAKRLGELLDQ